MNIQHYEEKIAQWDMYPDDIKPTIYLLGDFGELGELIEKIIDHYEKFKKIEKRQMKLALEIGDVYWYIFRFMNALGFSYIEIMKIKVGIKKSKDPLMSAATRWSLVRRARRPRRHSFPDHGGRLD